MKSIKTRISIKGLVVIAIIEMRMGFTELQIWQGILLVSRGDPSWYLEPVNLARFHFDYRGPQWV